MDLLIAFEIASDNYVWKKSCKHKTHLQSPSAIASTIPLTIAFQISALTTFGGTLEFQLCLTPVSRITSGIALCNYLCEISTDASTNSFSKWIPSQANQKRRQCTANRTRYHPIKIKKPISDHCPPDLLQLASAKSSAVLQQQFQLFYHICQKDNFE